MGLFGLGDSGENAADLRIRQSIGCFGLCPSMTLQSISGTPVYLAIARLYARQGCEEEPCQIGGTASQGGRPW